MSKAVPEGYRTITPYLVANEAGRLIDFLKEVFGAEETERMMRPDGSVAHAELRINDSRLMLSDAREDYPPMPAMLYLYVEDVDAAYKRAIDLGAGSLRVPTDEFYGDRNCGVVDHSGNQWWIASRIEDLSPEEMQRRHQERMAAAS